MYSRDFGNIRSEGTLYNLEHGLYEDRGAPEPDRAEGYAAEAPRKPLAGGIVDTLRGLKLDDLLIIAIGVLLLRDSEPGNDMIILLVAALLLF